MVLPIDPLTGAALMIMAASPKEICGVMKPAEINVVPKTKPVDYDYSQSLAQIQGRASGTVNPYGFGSTSHTNGYMKASFNGAYQVELAHKFLPRYGVYCVWYDKVTVNLSIDPKIVIAKEVAQDKCMGKAVLHHELKHVKVDRQVMNKYSKAIGREIYNGLKQRGFFVAGVPRENLDSTVKRMQGTVGQLMELELKKMEIERAERQRDVDSLEEYESVSAKCPDYVSPMAYGQSHSHKSSSASRRRR